MLVISAVPLSMMVNYCACIGCCNRGDKNKDKSFYRLPSVVTHQGTQTRQLSEERQRRWLAAIRRSDINPSNFKHTRVCSDHFLSGRPSALYDRTNPDWVPTLSLGHSESHSFDTSTHSTSRYERAKEREAKRCKLEVEEAESSDYTGEDHERPEDEGLEVSTSTKSVQTVLGQDDIIRLQHEVSCLKSKLAERTLSEEVLKTNDSMVLFYTGLPSWELLFILYNFIKDNLSLRSCLSPFNQLLITLMKLRLNLNNEDIGYRFAIHPSTVSRTITAVLDILYEKLKPLILWPSREDRERTMPMCFRKHCPSCAVIIDCFELFLRRPTDVLARAQTYSSYKHHNTVKYLIGITPQGTISYISKGWGGRVSDKHLTENSTLFNFLEPGDTILADRGFDIKESTAIYCARVVMPAFTKGKKQLTGIEVEQTRRIANVRIHVERVIGLVRKKYTILSDTLPMDYIIAKEGQAVPILDKIVLISCALVNFCDSVIPSD